jgi:hypothetical protein
LFICAFTALPAAASVDPTGRGARKLAAVRTDTHVALRRSLTLRIAAVDARRRYWLRLMHRPVRATSTAGLARLPLADLRRALDWRWQRAAALADAARHPPHLAGWLCIQRHETAAPYPGWRTASGNGYYGGLQLDRGFQATYGGWLYRSKGTAEHWTPLEQMWTAEFAHAHGRGFGPWPHTARACGLL